jgi:hypothetical protein
MPIRQLVAIEKVSFDAVAKTGKWIITSTQGETHSAAVYHFKIKHGQQSARLRLHIFSLGSMVVSNTDMPPVVRGKRYVTTLAATGGNPPYVWSIKASDLPSGLKVYDSTNKEIVPEIAGDPVGWCTVNGTPRIEGSVNSLDRSQETFGVAVSVASKNVVMAPSAETLYFRVVEGEQVGGIGANWATFVIGGISGLVVFLVWGGEKLWGAFKEKETSVTDAAKSFQKFLEGSMTEPGSLRQHLTTMNNDVIQESRARTNEIDVLRGRLDELTLRQDVEVRRLGGEILRLQELLSKETNVDLRKQADRDLGEVREKARRIDDQMRDTQEAKNKTNKDKIETKRRRDVSEKMIIK